MTRDRDDIVAFDERIALALADLTTGPAPRPAVKTRLMAQIAQGADHRFSRSGARRAVRRAAGRKRQSTAIELVITVRPTSLLPPRLAR